MIHSLGERRVDVRGDAYVAGNATVVGSVVLERGSSVWFNAVVRGDDDAISIGENSNVQDASVLHADTGFPLRIDRDVSIGHMAMVHGCTVGARTLVGINAVLLNGAVIGEDCLIGANALVSEGKVIPDRSLVLGSPGRVVREVGAAEIEEMADIVRHYVQLASLYRDKLRPQDGTAR